MSRLGKLTNEELKALLSTFTPTHSEVQSGAKLAEDCAVINADGLLLVTTDPITALCNNSGELAIKVCANDVISSGGTPFACMVTILLPSTADMQLLRAINAQITATARSMDIDVIGGHTEYTDAVTRPVISVTMLGKARRHVSSVGMNVGDKLIVTKHLGLEGTSILADTHAVRLSEFLSPQQLAEAVALKSSLSIMKEGYALRDLESVSAMHDVTEGGVLGAVSEMCESAGVGAVIYGEQLPILPVTRTICSALGIEAARLISSGSLIVATSNATEALAALKEANVEGTVIGEITAGSQVLYVKADGQRQAVTAGSDHLFAVGDTSGK